MSRVFWPLFAVSVVVSGLIFAALPFGPDLVYGVLSGAQLGLFVLLARACERVSRELDEPLSPPPPSHPVWRNPRA